MKKEIFDVNEMFVKNQKNLKFKDFKNTLQISAFAYLLIMSFVFNISNGDILYIFKNISWVLPTTILFGLLTIYQSKKELTKAVGSYFPDNFYISIFEKNATTSVVLMSIYLLTMSFVALFFKNYVMDLETTLNATKEVLNVFSNVFVSIFFTMFFIVYYFLMEKYLNAKNLEMDVFQDSLISIEK